MKGRFGFPAIRSALWAVLTAAIAAIPSSSVRAAPGEKPAGALRVATYNIAHGRGKTPGMVGITAEQARNQLDEISEVLHRIDADVFALQEVDAPSSWTGSFDHLAYLAGQAGFEHRYHGIHCRAALGPMEMQYGTALLARPPLRGTWSSPLPTESWNTKGAVGANIEFEGRAVVVVGVHLDSSDRASRREQVTRLMAELRKTDLPMILMGDLNSRWTQEGDAVQMLIAGLGLTAWKPEATDLDTFPAGKPDRRIDWILISSQLAFAGYGMIDTQVSDHLPVWADVRWQGESAGARMPGK
ncbi:MAG: endonuclease/exonuclease/phosphatase family protein [Phycisphaerae bacterium]|nr:endonuclease/exonuclease/phosphatase family protein [Phycisphaerae bacterium]